MRARSLQLGDIEPKHVTDPLYMLILEELFVRPNRVSVADLHTEANKLRQVQEVGGLSKEKLQAWKRVMAYLGMGWRVGDGFVCACVPSLLMEILDTWEYDEGPLQVFLEAYLGKFLPFQTVGGDLEIRLGSPPALGAQWGLALVARYDCPPNPTSASSGSGTSPAWGCTMSMLGTSGLSQASQGLAIFAPTADQRYLMGADVFLRTHFPMTMRRYENGHSQVIGEEDLLAQILDSTGHAPGNRLWVLYGTPGSGKSELIKLLERV